MSARLMPLLTGMLATALLGGVLSSSLVLPAIVAGPALLLLLFRVFGSRRPAVPERPWSPPVFVPVVVATPGSRWSVSGAIGRAEARQFALSPWFGVALGFLAIFWVTFGFVFSKDNGEVWHQTAGMLPWFAHPVAAMTILAVHRAVTRPARDGTDELFESCPTEPIVRIVGLLRTAVAPVATFATFVAVYGVTVVLRSPNIHGPVSGDSLPLVLAGLVLVTGAVCLGAALGSWVRFGLAPVVAVIAIGLLAIKLATSGDPGWNPLAALSTFGPDSGSPLLRELQPTWWYLLWISALTVLVGIGAVARYRRDWPVRLAVVVGVAVAVVAAAFGTAGPRPADARLIAARIAQPEAHQSCERPSPLVDVCTYRDYGELRAEIAEAVAPVAGALPADARPVKLRQGFTGTEADLPSEVRELLPAELPKPSEDEIWIGFTADDNSLLAYRLLVAFAALDLRLPLEAPDDGPLVIAGQARGVAALWLAARGLDADDAIGLATVENPGDSDENALRGPDHDAFELGLAWPNMCGPVVWAPEDLAAARALMRAPQSQVASVIDSDFARWADPETPTNDLLEAAGLSPVGRTSKVTTRTESYC